MGTAHGATRWKRIKTKKAMPQSLASILVHLVFSTKYRENLISPVIEPELYAYMAAVLRECKSPSLAINGTANHVHILLALHRTATMAGVAEEVKKCSSKWIKTKGAEFESFAWQNGYGAFSIGQTGVERVKNYIANQKEHHAQTTFEAEYRDLLNHYGIAYDERYVWD
jgi:REP element-mobilizing transposase RayT